MSGISIGETADSSLEQPAQRNPRKQYEKRAIFLDITLPSKTQPRNSLKIQYNFLYFADITFFYEMIVANVTKHTLHSLYSGDKAVFFAFFQENPCFRVLFRC